MADEKEQPTQSASTNEAKLAFVEGFLLGLARRLDDVGYTWPKAAEAADDCRSVAAMVKQVGVPMARVDPKQSS